jgi:competence protein ComEC
VRGRIPENARFEVLARSPLAATLSTVRGRIRDGVDRSLTPEAAGLARALVLGENAAADPRDLAAFRRAGLSHVLAVSGLHVAIVAGLALLLLRALLVRVGPLARRFAVERAALALAAGFALSFAEVAGGAPSARRAAITAALVWGLGAFGRRKSTPVCAAAAVALLAALDPEEAVHPGFLLSVLATLAVLTSPRPAPGIVEWVRAAFALSLRATLATAPVVWWCFDGVPLVGVLANVVLVPLGSLVLLPLAVAHASLGALSPDLALFVAPAFELTARAFVAACALFGRIDVGSSLPPLSIPEGVALSIGALLLLFAKRARTRALTAAATIVAMGLFEILLVHVEQPRDALRVTFVDVGQGDAALVDLPDGRLMVVDAGGGGRNPGKNALVPLLRARRRARVDVFVLSHPHPDHYEGLDALLGAMPVTELWDSGQAEAESRDGAASRLLRRARTIGTRVRSPADVCARARRFGRATVEVLAPCPRFDPGYDPNDNSLVLRIRLGRRAFLFSGDAEAHEEAMLVASGRTLRADVLKVGHHGSRTSSTGPFLDAVRPHVAVVSAGASNRFGHPHADVMSRLTRRRTRVLVTARDGGTTAWTDGEALTLEPWGGDAFEVP